jgi:type IV pilus assembly protein PilC
MLVLRQLDLTLFFRQFATLITANIPIIQCCDILETSQEKLAMRLLIQQIKRDLFSGKALSLILCQHPRYFNEFICQLIRIGEQTGKLDVMLLTIADHFEKNLALNRKIKQALFYPSIILLTGFLLVICMFIFVIPLFADMFQQANTSLPALTQLLFYLSAHMMPFFMSLLMMTACIAVFIKYKKGTIFHLLLKPVKSLPLINNCYEKIILARFTRNLAITFDAGIPIIDALRLTANISQQSRFTSTIHQVINNVTTGIQLHRALALHVIFPPFMIQMIKIGEQSGMLVAMLEKITAFLEADIEQLISRLTQLLEPLIMIVLGALIGGLVVGMYLPIFKLGSTL